MTTSIPTSLLLHAWETTHERTDPRQALAVLRTACLAAAPPMDVSLYRLIPSPEAVELAGTTHHDLPDVRRFRCAPAAYAQLCRWASAHRGLSLATARAEFRLLARVLDQGHAPTAMLHGLGNDDTGHGILVVETVCGAQPPDADSVRRLAAPFDALLERLRAQEASTTLGAELATVSALLAEISHGSDTSPAGHRAGPVGPSLDLAMRAHIESALRQTRGRVSGPRGAAVMLAVNANTLRARMRKLGIEPRRFARAEAG
ncbi:MAG: hypothetical protein AB7O38_30675 [Pirellulaceae bacterium]